MDEAVAIDQPWERRKLLVLFAFVAVIVVLNIAFPGITPWINDEPEFIRQAFLANKEGVLAKQVLVGNFGVQYFPLPIWLYQLGLLCTTNLIVLVFIKSCLSIGLTVAGLYLFIKNTRFCKFVVLIPLASPFQYIWRRTLWDNGMLIPASALFLGALACYLKSRTTGSLIAAMSLAILMLYIHPMAVPVVLAGAATVWIVTWQDLLGNKKRLGIAILAAFVLCMPYAWHLFGEFGRAKLVHTANTTTHAPSVITHVLRLFHYFTYWDFFDHFQLAVGGRGNLRPLISVLGAFTGIAVILLWVLGAISGVKTAVARWKSKTPWTAETALLLFASFGILLQMIMYLLATRAEMYHYYNAVWICVFLFVAKGATWVAELRHRGTEWAVPAVISIFVILHVMSIGFILENGGTRQWRYGPTLAQQIDVVREVLRKPPSSISQLSFEIDHYKWFKHAFGTLYLIYREKTPSEGVSKGKIRISYVNDTTGHICVIREE